MEFMKRVGSEWETLCIECTTGVASGKPVWTVYLQSEGIGRGQSFTMVESANMFADLMAIKYQVGHFVRIDSQTPASLPEAGNMRRIGMSLAEWK